MVRGGVLGNQRGHQSLLSQGPQSEEESKRLHNPFRLGVHDVGLRSPLHLVLGPFVRYSWYGWPQCHGSCSGSGRDGKACPCGICSHFWRWPRAPVSSTRDVWEVWNPLPSPGDQS